MAGEGFTREEEEERNGLCVTFGNSTPSAVSGNRACSDDGKRGSNRAEHHRHHMCAGQREGPDLG